MKIEISGALLQEFTRLYNAYNTAIGVEKQTLSMEAMASMAILEGITMMQKKLQEKQESDRERNKYLVDKENIKEFCRTYNEKLRLLGKPSFFELDGAPGFAEFAVDMATGYIHTDIKRIKEEQEGV